MLVFHVKSLGLSGPDHKELSLPLYYSSPYSSMSMFDAYICTLYIIITQEHIYIDIYAYSPTQS